MNAARRHRAGFDPSSQLVILAPQFIQPFRQSQLQQIKAGAAAVVKQNQDFR
jgi:hypothetical protein